MKTKHVKEETFKMQSLIWVMICFLALTACSKKGPGTIDEEPIPDPDPDPEQSAPDPTEVNLNNVEKIDFSWTASTEPVSGNLTLKISENENFTESESVITQGIVTAVSVNMEVINEMLGNGTGSAGEKTVYWRVEDANNTVIAGPEEMKITPTTYHYLRFTEEGMGEMDYESNTNFAYAYDISTTGTTPTVKTLPLVRDVAGAHEILSFQYKSEQYFTFVNVVYVKADGTTNASYPVKVYIPGSSGEEWAQMAIPIDKRPSDWGAEGDKLELTWGNEAGQHIQVRRIHFREAEEGEVQTFTGTPQFIRIGPGGQSTLPGAIPSGSMIHLGRPSEYLSQFLFKQRTDASTGVGHFLLTETIETGWASLEKSIIKFQYRSSMDLPQFFFRLRGRDNGNTYRNSADYIMDTPLEATTGNEWKEFSYDLGPAIQACFNNTTFFPDGWPSHSRQPNPNVTNRETNLFFGTKGNNIGAVFEIRNMHFAEE